MRQYKVGDEVTIRPNLEEGRLPGGLFVGTNMLLFRGCKARITYVSTGGGLDIYRLNIDRSLWWWSAECFVGGQVKRPKPSRRKLTLPAPRTKRQKALVNYVRAAKRGAYGVTAIKIEMEGTTSRGQKGHDWILKELYAIGLAEKTAGVYQVVKPITYSGLWSDGGDTEWSITILLNKSRNVLLLPKLLRIFNKLARVSGRPSVGTRNAGMHIAFLCSPDGKYPANMAYDPQAMRNFCHTATKMLPSLYLMAAAPDNTTRGTDYRKSRVSAEDKYSAIAIRRGCIEFRVFDPCYNQPDMVLDHVAVMCRLMRFWSLEDKTPKALAQYRPEARIDLDYYHTPLNEVFGQYERKEVRKTLGYIKPHYLTLSDICKARQIKLKGVKDGK